MDDLTALSERWLPILGFEGLYEVSDLGRVRSWRNTRGNPLSSPRYLHAILGDNGYLSVALRRNGKTFRSYIHALVLGAFVGPRPAGTEACHWDGVRRRNHLTNLRWDTRQANSADRKRHGTAIAPPLLRGEDHPRSCLCVDDVRCIKAEPEFRGVLAMLAKAFDVDISVIWSIRHRRTWRHVNG